MCNDARNDNDYDYDIKILRTSETKRSENIDNSIVIKNGSSKSSKANKKGQYIMKSSPLGRSESKCSGIVDRPVTPLLPVAQNSPSC